MALRQIVFMREALLARSHNCNNFYRQFKPQTARNIRTGRTKSSELQHKQLIPFESHDPGYIDPSRLWKAFVFTGTFTITSFATVSILEYERIRSRAASVLQNAKSMKWIKDKIVGKKDEINTELGQIKRELNAAWQQLTPGERVFIPLCALNVVVFGLWRIPRLQPFMIKYFCSNPAARAVCWPMILSTFSHYSAFHIFANMYVLHSFSNGAIASLGKEQFLGLYLSAGVISSFASYLYKTVMVQPGLSLGASGAIMAILAYVCAKYPDTQLSILFLPMFTFSAGSAIKVIMGLDLAGVVLGWKFFDHAAHLGGAAYGLFWCYYGSQHLWPMREHLIGYWHKMRGPITKS